MTPTELELPLTQLLFLGQIVLSFFLGGLIGLDRELANKPAGLRTHMLVAGGSTLIVVLGSLVVTRTRIPDELVQSDPGRMLEAVVTAIAFLGAGTIIQNKRGVEGLTTAASLLFVGATGMAVALEQYMLAIGATVITLIVLRWVGAFERWLQSHHGIDSPQPRARRQPGEAQGGPAE